MLYETNLKPNAYLLLVVLSLLTPTSLKSDELFSDDFTDGLKSQWAVVDEGTRTSPSKWQVSSGSLLQKSNTDSKATTSLLQPGTYVLAGDPNWTGYSVSVRLRTSIDDDGIGLMFGYRDSGNYYRLAMNRQLQKRRLVKVVNGVASLLAEDGVPYEDGRWYSVEARMIGGVIEIWIDGNRLFQANDVSHVGGKIALYTFGNMGAQFDDVLVSSSGGDGGGGGGEPCAYSISPSEANQGSAAGAGSVTVTAPAECGWTAATDAPWIQIVSGDSGAGDGTVDYAVEANGGVNAREAVLTIAGHGFRVTQAGKGISTNPAVLLSDDFATGLQNYWAVVEEGTLSTPSKWQVMSGVLQQKSNIFGTRSDPLVQPGTYLLTGNANWTDYTVSARMETSVDDDGMGLMFGYQDPGNYYRFSMNRQDQNRRFISVVNGMVNLLAEDRVPYDQGHWYAVEARMIGSSREIWIDGSRVFQVNDVSHVSGKIALYAWANMKAQFDDVVVTGSTNGGGGGGGTQCTYSISPSTANVGAGVTTGTVAVSAPSGCSWTATKSASWITITSGAAGTADGAVDYSVAANGGSTSRTTTLTIAGLPFTVSQAASQPSGGNYVPAGGDLQAALDQAAPGDTITLEPGATYTGHFILRKKSGNQYITITTADSSKLPAAGKRISPAYANTLPKIASPDDAPAIDTETGAHHYHLLGLEIHAPNAYSYELIRLGSATATTVGEQPSDIELDRVYLHGDPKRGAKRGLTLNSASTIIRNCYFSEFKGIGQDTQAIAGWNGPGPFEITNNYLEAAGENILFGGAAPSIQGLIPSDIQIRKNHINKQLSWSRFSSNFDGSTWLVKNSLELKLGRRVTIEGNVIENNWQQAQAGYAIVFTVRANKVATWAVVEDVSLVRNIIRHSGGGVNILGKDYNSNYMGIARRILIKDNLFEDIDYKNWGGEGRAFQVLTGSQDVTIDHNTVISNNLRMMIMLDGEPSVRFVYKNNIAPHGQSGVLGSGKGIGLATLEYYTPGYVFAKNVLVGGAGRQGSYPSGNFFPASFTDVRFVDYARGNYRLASNSPYSKTGTDQRDLGADIDAVLAAVAGAVAP